MLIEDGRDPAADRQRHVEEGRQPAEAQGEAGLPIAERHRLEAGAEVLSVERAAPDQHGDPGGGERLQPDVELRQAEEDEEHLHEQRRVPDHLHVDRRQLADHGYPVRAGGAQDQADHEGAGDRDRRHLERVP